MSTVDTTQLATIDDLLSRDLPTEEVAISGGRHMVVRALSREEALAIQRMDRSDVAALERHTLALAIVEPALSIKQVAAWQAAKRAGHNDIDTIAQAVRRLSGLAGDVAKESYKSPGVE